jgi:2-amino-4-hydroxy-6-hydroxymethyldihydropteridine diphosphokinase
VSKLQMPESVVLLAFGTNLGDRRQNWQRTLELLPQHGLRVIACSALSETRPIGGPDGQEPFLNAAITATTSLEPARLVHHLLKIEEIIGRIRVTRWGARLLDLDLLLYDHLVSDLSQCLVPHPRLTFRRFVLEPALEIAAEWQHPLTGTTLAALNRCLQQTPRRISFRLDPRLSSEHVAGGLRQPAVNDVLGRLVAAMEGSGYQVAAAGDDLGEVQLAAVSGDRGLAEIRRQPTVAADDAANLTLIVSNHVHPPAAEVRNPYLVLPIDRPETWLPEVAAALAAMQ